jgi:excisionase family DNA binding protein
MLKIILEKLEKIEMMLKEQSVQLMVFGDVCNYLNISRSHLYKLTSASLIPHYKPGGKMLYFKKSELN